MFFAVSVLEKELAEQGAKERKKQQEAFEGKVQKDRKVLKNTGATCTRFP